MTLFWLLCVCLLLGGLAVRRDAAAVLHGLRLRFFGAPVRVKTPPPPAPPPCSGAPRPAPDFLPTPRVLTRPGP
jgi:hypothetical protein